MVPVETHTQKTSNEAFPGARYQGDTYLHVLSPSSLSSLPLAICVKVFATSAVLQQRWNDPWRKRNPPHCVRVLAYAYEENAYLPLSLSSFSASSSYTLLPVPFLFLSSPFVSSATNNNNKFQIFVQVLVIWWCDDDVNGFWLLVFVDFMWPFLFRTTTHLLSPESRRKSRLWRSWSAGLMVSHLPSIRLTLHLWTHEGLAGALHSSMSGWNDLLFYIALRY